MSASINYRVLLGFDVIGVNVSEAEAKVSELVKAANSLEELKEDLVGLKIVELPDGSKDTQS